MAPEEKAKVTYKTFTYQTGVRWLEDRAGALESGGKPVLRVAPPPEFRGEERTWTPEDLFVGAVESCLLTTFLALASRAGVAFTEYASEAEGTLEFKDGGYRFTRIVVRPRIEVGPETDPDTVRELVVKAHEKCLISNSVRAEVTVDPDVATISPKP